MPGQLSVDVPASFALEPAGQNDEAGTITRTVELGCGLIACAAADVARISSDGRFAAIERAAFCGQENNLLVGTAIGVIEASGRTSCEAVSRLMRSRRPRTNGQLGHIADQVIPTGALLARAEPGAAGEPSAATCRIRR